jgi:hypothetical protein
MKIAMLLLGFGFLLLPSLGGQSSNGARDEPSASPGAIVYAESGAF